MCIYCIDVSVCHAVVQHYRSDFDCFLFFNPSARVLCSFCTPGNASKVSEEGEKQKEREKGGRERLLQSSSKSVFIYGAVCSECLFIPAFIGDRLFSPAYFSLCRSFDRFARLERTVELPGIRSLHFCNGERRFG